MHNYKKHIVYIGGAHIDRRGKLNNQVKMKTSNPGSFIEMLGGAALNSASIFQQCGGKSSLCALLGNDKYGKKVKEELYSRNIEDLSFNLSNNLSTATYTSIHSYTGDLIIAVADMDIYDKFDISIISQNQLSAIENCDCLLLDANLSQEAINVLCSINRQGLLALSCVSESKAHRISKAINKTDFLFGNLAELRTLATNKTASAIELSKIFASSGIKYGIITNQNNAVTFWNNDKISTLDLMNEKTIIDVTGAGDALVAGVLFSFLNKSSFTEAVAYGIEVAKLTLQQIGPYYNQSVMPKLSNSNSNK